MKLKEGFVLRKALDQYLVLTTGSLVMDFNGIITLSETGAFLFEKLQKEELSEQTLTALLLDEFEVDEVTAAEDVKAFVEKLRGEGFLQEETT